MRKVITQRIVSAFLGDIVGIESGHTIRSREGGIAPNKGCLAGKAVHHVGAGIAFLGTLDAEAFGGLHPVVGILVNHLEVVGVVKGHFGVVLVLDFGVGETVAHGQSGEI